MRLLVIALALLACACSGPEQQSNEVAAAEAGPVKGVDRSHKGKPFPEAAFADPEGAETTLADFQGAPTLVNLWATWCAPCVKELPTLQALAARRKDLQLVTISQDSAPPASVQAFLEHHKLDLPAYQDSQMALSGALGTQVLPSTILYDAEGREVWRYVGDLDWAGEEAAKLLAEARTGASG